MGNTPRLPIPAIQSIWMIQWLHTSSCCRLPPAGWPTNTLLTQVHNRHLQAVTVPMLARALSLVLNALGLDTGLYSLHILHIGGAMAAYNAGDDQWDIKQHGIWSSDDFWVYITAPCVATSPVARALAAATMAL